MPLSVKWFSVQNVQMQAAGPLIITDNFFFNLFIFTKSQSGKVNVNKQHIPLCFLDK